MRLIVSRFDQYWTEVIQRLPKSLSPLMQALTMFGQPLTMGVLVGIAGLIALLQSDEHQVMLYSVTLVLIPIASVIKIWVHRPRPATYTRTWLPSYSFPSGHAYSSTLVLSIIAFANHSWPAAAFSVIISVLVGLSRIYRRSHFPSDVLGGWVIAIPVLVAVCINVGR